MCNDAVLPAKCNRAVFANGAFILPLKETPCHRTCSLLGYHFVEAGLGKQGLHLFLKPK